MFAPLIVLIRNLFGTANLTRLRGQLIARHVRAINWFCDRFGLDRTQRQNLIRLARDNGKKLGLLA